MKALFLSLFCLFSFSLSAQDISKEHVLSMLEQMKKEGIVPADKAPEIEAKIKGLSDAQFEQIKGVARGIAAQNPQMNQTAAPTLQNAANSVDVDSKAFKDASKELEKIIK